MDQKFCKEVFHEIFNIFSYQFISGPDGFKSWKKVTILEHTPFTFAIWHTNFKLHSLFHLAIKQVNCLTKLK